MSDTAHRRAAARHPVRIAGVGGPHRRSPGIFLRRLAFLVALGACDTPDGRSSESDPMAICADPGAGAFASADSAGTAIAVSRVPTSSGSSVRRSDEAAVTVGVTHGDAAYEFGRITGATVLSDGRIVVADGQTRDLRAFSADGRFLVRVGGSGAGPGEYRFIASLHRGRGDTLVVNDMGQRRLTVLAPDLSAVRTTPIAPIPWSYPPTEPGGRARSGSSSLRVLGLFDGGILASNSLRNLRTEEITNVSRDSLVLRRLAPDGVMADSLGIFLGSQSFEFYHDGSVTFGDALLGYRQAIAVGPDRFWYAAGYDFEIEERSPDGRLLRLIRLCEAPDVVDAARLNDVIEARLAGFEPAALEYEEPALYGIPHPEVAPALLDLRFDGRDRLWARDFTYPADPQRWKVFDMEGRWLGEIELTAGSDVLEFGPDYVLTRHTDELDVQTIRSYRLETVRR